MIGNIDCGILLLLGIEKNDEEATADRMIDKLLAYRIFPNDSGRMNLSVKDIGGAVLVVSQFTLVADTKKGLRPGFSNAAAPELAESLYNYICTTIQQKEVTLASGQFGANMQVSLVNDGPVTFLLEF